MESVLLRRVYDLRSVVELQQYYSGIEKVLGKTFDSSGFDADRYKKCWDWAHDPKNHNSISAGWALFTRFLEWREAHNNFNLMDMIDSGVHFWTYSPGAQACAWLDVQKDKVIALSYKEVGDFSKLGDKDAIVAAFQKVAGDETSHKNSARAVIDFRDVMKPGDYVFAKKGTSQFIGVGKVTGDFYYDATTDSEYRNRRSIDWFKIEDHDIGEKSDRKTLTDITPYPDFVKKLFAAYGLDGDETPDEDVSLEADRLPIALKLFQRQRAGDGWIGSESSEAMRQEFIDWCVKVDGKAKATPLTYLPPLVSVSKPLEVESMKSSWNGVYEFIFGSKPTKHVLEITSATELDEIYNEFLKVYAVQDWPIPKGAKAANWNKVRAWVKADKVKGSNAVIIHAGAFAKYRQFLKWREANGDMAKGGPNGWASYDAWAKAARETFAKVDAGMLVAADFDYAEFARKFVYSPKVANAYFKDHKEDEKREVGNFISQNRQTPKAVSWYLEKTNLPVVKGLGVGCALNFMMKVRPAEFATYSPMIDKALMSVGLLARPLPDDPTVESYEQSKSLQGQVLAKMHELNIGKAADDESAADYLTVNEFAWWLSDEKNQNLIKEKVMGAQLKPVDSKKTVIKGNRALSDAFKDDEMLKRLAAALRTKPFAILAGHSGTGKSQLVRRLAYMTCNNQKLVDEGKDKTAPGNYCMVQVKPNWHDSTDLLGYYSDLGTRHFVNTAFVQFLCKAYAYPETPFFLCLDEMNLAPVEQYFAEYLSAVESLEKKGGDWVSDSLIEIVKTGEKDENGNAKVDEEILGQIIAGAQSTEAADWIRKHGLTIPKNLFVVGTVNMDETTCQFSRKVLDRAMTLLMNEVKFAEMCKAVDPSKEQLLDDAGVAFFMQGSRRGHVDTVEAGLLDNLNKPLANTPFVVAYRFANEYALYEEALANLNGVPQLDEGEADEAKIAEHWKKVSEHAVEALDHVVLMKLLPRIHGMKDVVKGIFEGRKIAEKDTPGLKDEVKADGLSAGMMTEILNRGDEYLTFWP